jgi:CheY-like chemotaxis protein
MLSQTPGNTILVAEDDPATRQALAGLLTAAGYSVTVAADGQEALNLLRRGPAPDLVLLDLVMPVLDGWQFLQEQQQDPTLADIPVVIVSGSDRPPSMEDSKIGALIRKPIEFGQLLAVIRDFVTTQRPGVLVVDDSDQVRHMLELALGHHDFMVWTASGGQEAVEVYRQHHAAVAVVLLDVRMPVMDGPATLKALKQIDPGVRCCFMSGDTGEYRVQDLIDQGAAHVFAKPFGLAQVTQALRQLVAAR